MTTSREMITFLSKEGTKKKLKFLAKLTERSQSAYLRWIIDREYEAVTPHLPDNGKEQSKED
jgi:predicted DNA-binding protein